MSINLTPLTDTNLVNENHTVTATITDGSGNPQQGIEVTFSILSGPNQQDDADTDTTDANGEATFTYTGDGGVGTDVIVACYTNDANQKICSQTVNKVWNPPQIEYKITLSPEYDLNLVGQDHTVTATVTEDGSGTPQSGVEVTFTIISGPNTSAIGTATTNGSGQASIVYTGTGGVGTDNIQACFTREEETICSNVVKKEWTEEAISLSPLLAQNPVNTNHTVTVTIQTLKGDPVQGVQVRFKVKSGPNENDSDTDNTGPNGEAIFTYTGDGGVGTDTIQGCFTNAAGQEVCTDTPGRTGSDAIKEWGSPCPAIEPNPDQLTNAVKGVLYEVPFTGFGGVEPYTFTSADLPAWLNLTSAGALSGTPTTEGNYTFTVKVTDKNDCPGERQYTLFVGPGSVCPTITFAPSELPKAVKDVSYGPEQITASGGKIPYTFAITSGNLPPGMLLSSTGLLSGTPTLLGIYTFTVGVTDDVGCPGELQYTLRVNTSGSCPTITVSPSALTNAVKDVFYSQQFTASGGTSPYTFAQTSGSVPPGMTLGSDGLLSGKPTNDGTYTFTVTATDNEGCPGSRQLTLEVCPAGYLIPQSDKLSDGLLGKAYSETITASAGSATFERAGDLPPGLTGTATANSYVISGKPTKDGTWTIKITATTSGGCAYSRFYSITIVNPIPTLSEWGMIVFMVLLIGSVLLVMRRRNVMK